MPESRLIEFLVRKVVAGSYMGDYIAHTADPAARFRPGYGKSELRALLNLVRYMVENEEGVAIHFEETKDD